MNPYPFHPEEQVPGATMTRGDYSIMHTAIAEHVVGHRVTKVEFTRQLDETASREQGKPLDNIDLVVHLDNNVSYVCRLTVHSLATVSRGEALAHIPEGDPNHVG